MAYFLVKINCNYLKYNAFIFIEMVHKKYIKKMLEEFFEKNRLRIGILLILIYAPLLFVLIYPF
ncbi:hypothetical protein IWQ47_004893 [Aquimarina sp. EL_43]|nr:hypothetical protein [Aquimarina sp. EL_35]MBG6153641.1 hypothetical protein [Aquimarina sp. EL_32]MBG6171797.1 hypothetical protein [Aquimarina sp. EL_43]